MREYSFILEDLKDKNAFNYVVPEKKTTHRMPRKARNVCPLGKVINEFIVFAFLIGSCKEII